jgi:hypothetical protein
MAIARGRSGRLPSRMPSTTTWSSCSSAAFIAPGARAAGGSPTASATRGKRR